MSKPGRNDDCPCGSGKKYKKCCLTRHEAARPRGTVPNFENDFIAELRPDLDAAADRLLQRLELGERGRIQVEIEALYEMNPGYHMTNYAMGVYMAMAAKDPRRAVSFFETAVQIFPPFPEAHFNLGNAARQDFNILKAVEAYRMAERYSCNEDGIAEMARKELQSLEAVLLRTTTFKSLDAYKANARLFDEAFQCLAERRLEKAVDLFKRVLEGNPEHVQSYGNMALAYAGLGRRSEAMACFDRALELDPTYEPALINRRNLEQLREGEPLLPGEFREVEYYGDRLRNR